MTAHGRRVSAPGSTAGERAGPTSLVGPPAKPYASAVRSVLPPTALLAAALLVTLGAGCDDVKVIPFPSSSGSSQDTCSLPESCTVVTLAAQRAQPSALALDGTHVYWVDRGGDPGTAAILKTLKHGGPVELLAAGQGIVSSLAVDDTHVYWTNLQSPGVDPAIVAVMRVSKDGGSPEAQSPVQSNPWGVATGDGQVVWTNLPADGAPVTTGEVWTMPAGGGEPMLLAPGQKTPISVTVQAGRVYWLNGGVAPGEESAVMAAPAGGGEIVELCKGSFFPLGLGVDEGQVYFTNSRTTEGKGNVMKVPLAGGEAEIVAGEQDHPASVVRRGDHLYWTNSGSTDPDSRGGIMKLAMDASAPTPMLESGAAHPFGLAVDETHVYWTDGAAGKVLKMNRCCPDP